MKHLPEKWAFLVLFSPKYIKIFPILTEHFSKLFTQFSLRFLTFLGKLLKNTQKGGVAGYIRKWTSSKMGKCSQNSGKWPKKN